MRLVYFAIFILATAALATVEAGGMMDIDQIDYSGLDIPPILEVLFHPRREATPPPLGAEDVLIPVADDVHIGSRLHHLSFEAPMLLFFHGNGEVVSDYDDLAPFFKQAGGNFFCVDYRGYGKSGGTPTVTNMVKDARRILFFIIELMRQRNYSGPLIVMGRSLGSISALELAGQYPDTIDGLIIESGLAEIEPLLARLSMGRRLKLAENSDLGHLHKIARFEKPTLVIHAEFDHIIAFEEGVALFEASGAEEKSFLKIPKANHNDIFYQGGTIYMEAVTDLIRSVSARE